jgi:RNA polymerase sigma-70 factor (ECF subfamily)
MSTSSQMEDWVVAAQQGDRVALAKLLTACHPQMRSWAAAGLEPAVKARCGPDDILQEVYLDVARQIQQFENRGPGSFLSWIHGILNHKLIDAQRAAHAQARDVRREVRAAAAPDDSYWSLLDQVYAESGTPSRVVRRDEALRALLSCLTELSEVHRRVIQLRFLEGLSVDQVAARLGKTSAAVVALSRRALEALRKSMDRRGEFTRGV